MVAPLLLAALAAASPPAPRGYDVTHYGIEFELLEEDAFRNRVTVEFQARAPLPRLELDAYGLEVQQVLGGDGTQLPFTVTADEAHRTGTLVITPPRPFPAGMPQAVVVTCSGTADGSEHAGLFVVREGGEAWYYTQFEPTYARRFFPSNDVPSDKATTEVWATVPREMQALSNGTQLEDEPVAGGTRHRVHWRQEKPHAPYLVALAVGRFERVPVDSSVPAALWVRPGTADRAFVAAEATRQHLAYQAKLLGVPYPWEKYDQVAVPNFTWGGMENTSLVTLREHRMVVPTRDWMIHRPEISGLVAHELAHQWFGNLVTLRGWDDTWLNEGFATWLGGLSEQAAAGDDHVRVERAVETFVGYMQEEDGPRSHPLQAKGAAPEEIFDGISYTKGARVLEMLEAWLGTGAFRGALKGYLETYAYQNVTTADLFAALGKATGREREVRTFQEAWLPRRGYPVLQPSWRWANGKLTLTVMQRPNHAGDRGAFVFKLPVAVHRRAPPAYDEALVITVDRPSVTVTLDVPAAPGWITWNQDGGALAKVPGPSVPAAEWTLAARADPDPTWRLLALLALAEPLFDEDAPRLPPADALSTLLSALSEDPSPAVRAALLERLGEAELKRLPAVLGPTVLALAQRPEGLPGNAVGALRVQAAALELLGRTDFPQGHALLLAQVGRPDLAPDLVEAVAAGCAAIGTGEALVELRAALRTQRERGSFFYGATLSGLAAFPGVEVLPHLLREMDDGAQGAEATRRVLGGLHDNSTLLKTPEGVAFVRDFVLDEGRGDDTRQSMLELLDHVHVPAAQAALDELARRAQPDSLRQQARRVLDANFPNRGAKR